MSPLFFTGLFADREAYCDTSEVKGRHRRGADRWEDPEKRALKIAIPLGVRRNPKSWELPSGCDLANNNRPGFSHEKRVRGRRLEREREAAGPLYSAA